MAPSKKTAFTRVANAMGDSERSIFISPIMCHAKDLYKNTGSMEATMLNVEEQIDRLRTIVSKISSSDLDNETQNIALSAIFMVQPPFVANVVLNEMLNSK